MCVLLGGFASGGDGGGVFFFFLLWFVVEVEKERDRGEREIGRERKNTK